MIDLFLLTDDRLTPYRRFNCLLVTFIMYKLRVDKITKKFYNNKYKFNQDIQRYELVKDSSITGSDVEQKMKLIEDYFYFNKGNSISDKSKHQSVSEMYYVIAKINGEYVIETLYDYSKD